MNAIGEKDYEHILFRVDGQRCSRKAGMAESAGRKKVTEERRSLRRGSVPSDRSRSARWFVLAFCKGFNGGPLHDAPVRINAAIQHHLAKDGQVSSRRKQAGMTGN